MNMALEFWPSARRQRRAYPAQWVCKELAIPARRERPKQPARLCRLFPDGPRINFSSTATKRLPHTSTTAIYASPNRHAINIYQFYNNSLRNLSPNHHHHRLSDLCGSGQVAQTGQNTADKTGYDSAPAHIDLPHEPPGTVAYFTISAIAFRFFGRPMDRRRSHQAARRLPLSPHQLVLHRNQAITSNAAFQIYNILPFL